MPQPYNFFKLLSKIIVCSLSTPLTQELTKSKLVCNMRINVRFAWWCAAL